MVLPLAVIRGEPIGAPAMFASKSRPSELNNRSSGTNSLDVTWTIT
jgi:hypothetical protein